MTAVWHCEFGPVVLALHWLKPDCEASLSADGPVSEGLRSRKSHLRSATDPVGSTRVQVNTMLSKAHRRRAVLRVRVDLVRNVAVRERVRGQRRRRRARLTLRLRDLRRGRRSGDDGRRGRLDSDGEHSAQEGDGGVRVHDDAEGSERARLVEPKLTLSG